MRTPEMRAGVLLTALPFAPARPLHTFDGDNDGDGDGDGHDYGNKNGDGANIILIPRQHNP
jgi:hypothetical protein